MSIGPIPWHDIIKYATWYGLARDVTEAFVDIIREMDRAYIEYQVAAQKRAADANKPSKKVAK